MAKKKKRRASPLFRLFKALYMFLFVICAIIVVGYTIIKITVKPPPVADPPVITIHPSDDPNTEEDESQNGPQTITLERKEQFYTFLLMGSDDGNGNADTIMVCAYDVKNNKVSVLSVPRDTLVDVSRTVKKLNGAYGAGGVDQVMDELTPILGFRPDHYIKVDIQAFKDVVNALGGVSFYVPCDMYHDDGAGFIINLKEGTQWLDGNKALQLVRYRGYASADLGRIQTQQRFLQQLAKQSFSLANVTKINEFARIFSTYLDTDLSVTELAYFGTEAMNLDFSSDLTFATLPGDGSTSYKGINWYYQLYPEECLELINSMVNPYTTDITPGMTHIFQVK